MCSFCGQYEEECECREQYEDYEYKEHQDYWIYDEINNTLCELSTNL